MITVSNRGPAHSFAFASLKAFGDLVILRSALARANILPAPAIVIGSHLFELGNALGSYCGQQLVVETHGQVPAIFDLRRRGIGKALRSAIDLHRRFCRLEIDGDAPLTFDKLGWRERFIARGRSVQALPDAANIYLAYSKLLREPEESPAYGVRQQDTRLRTAGIFPASRIGAKNLPSKLIGRLVQACRNADLQPIIHLLEGERPELEGFDEHVRLVPRSFRALAAAVRSVDLVLSADSLPAHLAEYFGRPVFVLTPVDNEYWLPLGAFVHRRWARFEELTMRSSRLASFLSSQGSGIPIS